VPPVSGPTWPIFTSSTLGAAGFASALAAGFCSPQPASATEARIRVIPSFMSFMGSPLPGGIRVSGGRYHTGRDPRLEGTRPDACVAGGQKLWRTPMAMEDISRPATGVTLLTLAVLA